MSLTFNEEDHSYHWSGRPVPSVTQVLAPVVDLSAVPPDILSAAAAFGTAVHKACELDDLGVLDEAALDAPLVPYLDAWRRFSYEHSVIWDHVEKRLYHRTLRYAGTADRIGRVDGVPSVVDIKTSATLYPSVGLQLAAYERAISADPLLDSVSQRISVRLKPDGSYEMHAHQEPDDFAVFASLLTLRNWCRKNSINPSITKEHA